MIGHLAYLVALSAPELAVEAGTYLAQAAGRNFVKGVSDELNSRFTATAGPLANSFFSAIGGGSAISKNIQESVGEAVNTALKSTNVELVNTEELNLLRELATAAATNGDVQAVVGKLKAFHASQRA